jgi:endonuclease/exonuclease/phosphatase family metal-dependent hydrolase
MEVVTWNVLHRVHAENWREAVPDRFPIEAERIARITRRVAGLLAGDDVVVCLQEVSGDQLRSLRENVKHHAIVAFRYPRVPALRTGAPCPLDEPGEHLVTIGAGAALVTATAWANDPGKGALVVDVPGLRVVNTHQSGGEKRGTQLAALGALAGDRTVVAGDFNSGAADVLAGLGGGFIAAGFAEDALPTRPRPERADRPADKPRAIDHILTRGLDVDTAVVVDVDGESDHNLVHATVGAFSGDSLR